MIFSFGFQFLCSDFEVAWGTLFSLTNSMFYDPLGLATPIILQSKLIYLSLCKEKLNWDTIVPECIWNVWDKFIETVSHSEKIIISRLLFNIYDECCFFEIHGFADKSFAIHSSVMHMWCVLGNCSSTTLLCFRSRLIHSQSTTIPRLELSACVLLSEHFKDIVNPFYCLLKNANLSVEKSND